MPRPRKHAQRYFRPQAAADLMGMSLTTWKRYWPTQPDLVTGAVVIESVRFGPKKAPLRVWPEDVLARHQQALELRGKAIA